MVSLVTPYLQIYRSLPVPTDTPRARVIAELKRTVAGNQHAAAVEHARRLLALIDACGESVLPDRPLALSTLGIALLRSGQIADAVRTGPAALEAAEHLLGSVHTYTIQAVQNLASILREVGRLAEAEPLARLALRCAQEALDPGSKEQLLALAHDNLGTLLLARAEHMDESGGETGPLLAEGCEHLREALDRWSRLFGTGHAQYRRTLSSLAVAQQRAGEAEAAATSQRQIDQNLDSGEASHAHDDQVLSNAAMAAVRAKDWKGAATFYRRSVDLARTNGIGRTPALAARLADLAMMLGLLDQPMAAFEATQEAAFVDDLLIGQIFSIASTDERAQLLKEVRARDDRMLSLVSSWLSSEVRRLIETDTSGLGENPESTVRANAEVRRFVRSTIAVVAGTVLQRKGLSVEALSVRWEAMMAGRYPEMMGALHELRELELEIARRSMARQDASSVDKQASATAALTDRARRLEARIVQHIPEMDISLRVRRVSAFDVVARLPPGSMLLEYVRYESSATTRYAQVIVPAGRSDALDFVDLGPAEDIDHDVAAFRAEILGGDARAAVRDPRVKAPAALPSQRSEVGRRLRATLVDGALASLPAATRLLVAPDGDLCWLPFGALPLDGDGYLQDRLAVSYVGSGRDVLGWDMPRLRGLGDPLVATAPAFGDGAACGVHFGPLPGPSRRGAQWRSCSA